jgi:hypothetical protein
VNREQAEAKVRERCRTNCRALLCETNERCMALLYDTPGFYKEIEAAMNDSKAVQTVECPCCHGEGHLFVYDATLDHIQKMKCCHCMGKGYIPSEIAE